MINQDNRDFIAAINPDVYVFDNPSFDNSIIGIDIETDVVIYSLSKMIRELANDDDISEEEALDFIDYNTIRVLPYMEKSKRPIIVDDIMFEEVE